MKHTFGMWAARCAFLVAVSWVIALFCVGVPAGGLAHAAEVDDGVYEVGVLALQATRDEASMCDGALVNPSKLTVSGGTATLGLTLQPLSLNGLSGYLGAVKCFPDWTGSGIPSAADGVAARIVSTYDVSDAYTAAGSSDDQMRGKKYPKEVAIAWDLASEVRYIQVYVPVMNEISAGSGWQFVRLKADYATLKRIGDAQVPSGGDSQSQGDGKASSVSGASEGAAAPDSSGASESSGSSTARLSSAKTPSKSASGSKKLKFSALPDGEYVVAASVVKTDKKTPSMADGAVSHEVGLTVVGGSYKIELGLSGMTVGGKSSYLGKLRYFKSGYRTDAGGMPSGKTAACKVLSYQMSGKSRLFDQYGGDYPAKVRLPLIPEAKSSGYVPLSAFVPVMETIAAGSGTQAMYLKLDRGSVAAVGSSGASVSAGDGAGTRSAAQAGASGGVETGAGAAPPSMLGTNTLPSAMGAASSDLGGAAPSHAEAASASADTTIGDAADAASAPVPTVTVREASVAAPAARSDEKEPPLKHAAMPVGVAAAAIVVAGGAATAFRHRSWMDE